MWLQWSMKSSLLIILLFLAGEQFFLLHLYFPTLLFHISGCCGNNQIIHFSEVLPPLGFVAFVTTVVNLDAMLLIYSFYLRLFAMVTPR